MRPSGVRYLVLAALCVITAVAYLQRNCIGAAEKTLRVQLRLTADDTGTAISAFFLTYALLQIPSGWLAQRWGPRRTLAALAFGWSLALAAGALADGLGLLLVSRLAMGALQAGIFPCATLAFAIWFPPTQRALASGVLSSFMRVGSIFAALLTGLQLQVVSWRSAFALYAVPGVMWSVWFVWWFRDRPREHPNVNPAELELIGPGTPPRRRGEATPWLRLLLSPALFFLNAQQFCRAGAAVFFDVTFVNYLQEVRRVPLLEASAWASLPLAASVLGTLIGGWLSDWILARTGSRRAARQWLSAVTLVLGVGLCGLSVLCPDVGLAVLLCSAGNLVLMASAPCAYALTMDMGGKHVAVVFSAMNMAGNLGAMAFPYTVGKLVQAGRWDLALAVFAGLYLVAAVCWVFLNPNGTIGDEPDSTPSPEADEGGRG
jgi:ACS family glucarate transporter-like MFS transporter